MRDFVLFGNIHQLFEQAGMDIRPEGDAASFVQCHAVFIVDTRLAGKCHVQGDADIGVHAVGAGHGTLQTNFLLDRGDGEHIPRVMEALQLVHCRDDGGHRRPIVHGFAGHEAVLQLDKIPFDGDQVADRYRLGQPVFGDANVDE